MDISHKLHLPLLKLGEPNFMPRDEYQFDVPSELLATRFQNIAQDLESRFDSQVEKIPVKQISVPELKTARNLPKNALFSVFSPIHRQYSNELIQIFLQCKNHDDLLSTALYCHDQVNSYLFSYAYSVALLNRKDTQNVKLPTPVEIFPEKLITRAALIEAREESFVVPEKLRRAIVIPPVHTASERDPEQRMAYFREDIGVNSHHWHWHIVFPGFGPTREIYDKDRRGELFYFMHQQVLARYNIDRMCNQLKLVKSLDLTKPAECGYYPKLTAANSSRTIVGRQENTIPGDVRQFPDFPPTKVSDVEFWTKRLRDGIQQGFLLNQRGEKVRIDNDQGINLLGNTIEDSQLNVNFVLYGSVHGQGHILMALCHDPENEFLEQPGVMADTSTAMRDPVFYQWHSYINDIFSEHKSTLPAYTEQQLGFTNITVDKLDIICRGNYTEQLETFWQKSDINLSAGLDFVRSGAIRATFTHLNFEDFKFKITIKNTGVPRRGTVRIFILPIFNDANRPFSFEGSRRLATELDRFVVQFKQGENVIFREATDSTVTVPFSKIFPPIEVNQAGVDESFSQRGQDRLYCSCGWPEYLLIPKGTVSGYPCNLFVMVSDYEQDKVIQEFEEMCSGSSVFCGLRDKQYPDKRPMGFPFDRSAPFTVQSLENFKKSNMAIKRITIKHFNEVKKHYKAEPPKVKPTTPGQNQATGNNQQQGNAGSNSGNQSGSGSSTSGSVTPANTGNTQ